MKKLMIDYIDGRHEEYFLTNPVDIKLVEKSMELGTPLPVPIEVDGHYRGTTWIERSLIATSSLTTIPSNQ